MKKNFAISALSQAIFVAITLPAMANEEIAHLDEITVSGGSMYRMGEVPVHQAKSAVAINREMLDQQAVNKVDEIARYQAGFANQIFGEDTNTNWLRVRGAEVSQAVDGLPTFSYGFFNPYVNSFGLEAVEITKGADAMTFGAAQSGGLINYVSKRPHKEQVGQGELKLNIGNNTQYGIGADYTGQFAENARYRFVGYYGGKDGQSDNTKNETIYIAPSVEFDLTERTRLTLLANYQRDHGIPSSNFLPQEGTVIASPNGYISRSANFGDPVNDTETNRQYSVGYEFAHDFANGLSINSRYRYSHIDNFHRGSYIYPSAYDATWNLITPSANNYSVIRGVVFNDGKAKSHTADNHLTWNANITNWFKNTLVIGTDYRYQNVDARYTLFGTTSEADISNPTAGYNQAQDVSTAPHVNLKAQQFGFYLQNQSRFAENLVLGLGIRHDRAKIKEYQLAEEAKYNETSYSYSLMYESAVGINPYLSYSEAFHMPVGISGVNKLYSPQTTKQYEVGIKYLPTWLDGTISIATFQAKDTGALVSRDRGATVSSEDPIRRRGIELQADVNLTNNWNLGMAYTYLQAYSQTPVGNVRRPLLPKNTLAARTAYNFSGAFEGLMLGAGVRHIGSSVGQKDYAIYPSVRVPSATVVDLMARYQFKNGIALQVNADNVGDRRYVAACDNYCYYGAGRNINASVSYKF
ncbi:iron complex outermembrane receptor protein [Bibersteinia trehalosi]|uniref:TonB-dependent siderophore receptor n=1 Tax=Bibersteinia trehalosi TaxID=47735 RepID=UPI0010518F94|nr:TonB-dependent receptor [Bibersteinia trehalosi]TCT15905.1 iron complex outermembrane receptor protein [Bibersteinia trehalosi]